jgi:hypothetical protein
MEMETEEAWLRHHILRLRTLLRFANVPSVETGLKELIAEAEQRMAALESHDRDAATYSAIKASK